MTRLMRMLACGLCLLVSVAGVQAQELAAEIDQVMSEFVELDLFSGTVLVAKGGVPVYARAFGEANKDHHVANTLETRFNIGSIGKTLTGTAIMQLVDRGEVELEAAVARYLEDFPYGDTIRIHHLLSHTSGMFNYMAHPEYRARMTSLRRIDDFLPLIYDQHLVFETPGERFAYSNSGIVVLGAVIEKVSGMPYEEFIAKNILGPAGMTSTGINFWDEVVPNRAMGYTRSLSGRFTAAIYQVPPACADGGLETTVLDLLRFDRALTGEILLTAEAKKKMYTPNLDDYGYTWTILERNGRKSISHGGGAPGVSAMFLRFPDDDVTIIVLSNYSGAAFDPSRAIEAVVFGEEFESPKPPIGEALYRALAEGEIEATAAGFEAE